MYRVVRIVYIYKKVGVANYLIKRLIKVIHMTGIAAQFIAEAFITPHCKLIILETMNISEFSL